MQYTQGSNMISNRNDATTQPTSESKRKNMMQQKETKKKYDATKKT